MAAPRDDLRARLIEATGGPETYAAYIEARTALRKLAKCVPRSLGLDIADIYKATTEALDVAVRRGENA